MGNEHDENEAQRDLERKALKNVRALVDKLEDGEAAERGLQKKMVIGAVVAAVVVAGVAFFALKSARTSESQVVIPPPAAAKK